MEVTTRSSITIGGPKGLPFGTLSDILTSSPAWLEYYIHICRIVAMISGSMGHLSKDRGQTRQTIVVDVRFCTTEGEKGLVLWAELDVRWVQAGPFGGEAFLATICGKSNRGVKVDENGPYLQTMGGKKLLNPEEASFHILKALRVLGKGDELD